MLSIAAGGVPTLSYNAGTISFTDVDVRSDNFVHLAICIDKNNNTAKCYVDGELAQTIEGVSVADANLQRTFRIGGDLRNGNPAVFKGKISSMAFYKDIRISREVAEDVTQVDPADENLIGAYDFNAINAGDSKVVDRSGKKNHLKIEKVWLDEVEIDDYAYSFAVVGDTQYVLRDNPEQLATIYDWILANAESEKIEYVIGLGDIVEHLYMDEANLADEWQLAREAISRLNGKVGYSLVRGNHDHSRFFNETFGDDAYLAGIDGIYEGIENSYRTIVAGNYQYLIMTLDEYPDAGELAWANQVVEAHPNHRVIITTHSYIHYDTNYLTETRDGKLYDGEAMWTDFAKKHANVTMILCGHVAWDPVYRQDIGDNGNVVTQILIDPQDVDWYTGSTGMVAKFFFSEDGSKVQLRYYSTIRNQYYRAENQFDIDLGNYGALGLVTEDMQAPKISIVNPQMGVVGTSYRLPEVVVTDEYGSAVTTSYLVYKKGDANKTSIALKDNAFTPSEGGFYVLAVTATDAKGNSATEEFDLPIRDYALASGVLEDFATEVSFVNFTGGADAEWLSEWQGKSGVLHLFPNQTDKSYYWFRLFEAAGDYNLPFNSITMRVWVDAENANGEKVSTSFYDTYEGKWQGVGNGTTSGWKTVTFEDFYNWEYFSESAKTSKGAQLFWSWTKNSHIYIDEITFNATQTIVVELDKDEYKRGDTVNVTAYLEADKAREIVISVVDPNGNNVLVTDGSFVMELGGKYIIKASLTSPSWYASSYSVEVEALVEHIVVEEYKDKVGVGSEVTLPAGSVYNPFTKENTTDAVMATVTFGGETVNVENGKFTANEAGVYVITYQATLANGTALPSGTVLEKVIKIYASDRLIDFVASETDCLVDEGEWLADFEGAYGVMKATYDNSPYNGFIYRTNKTVEELKALDWDFIEIKVWVGGTGSNPDPVYQVGDSYKYLGNFARNQWARVRLTKEQIQEVSGLDYFYEKITGDGIELFWAWNATNEDWYIDYVNFKASANTNFFDFIDPDSAEVNFDGTGPVWLSSYEGANGVLKGSYADTWGKAISFKLDITKDKLEAINWDYVEFKVACDFEGGNRTSWDVLTSNTAGWTYTTDGVWRIYKAYKNGIIAQFGSVDAFYTAITTASARMFTLWNLPNHGNFYFDYFKLCADNFDRVMDFETEDEISFLRSGTDAEWLESSTCDQGVTENGVISYYHGTTQYAGVKFQFNNYTNMTLDDWDKIEIRIRLIRGSNHSNPGTDGSFGTFYIGNTSTSIGSVNYGWSTLTITKQQIEDSDQYSAESFWSAFTSEAGARLFWCYYLHEAEDWTIQISSISLLKA